MSNESCQVCAICLESAQSRGGVPLFSPGCCGKWFHQSCIDAVIAAGTTKCPNCRKDLPVNPNAATLPRPLPASVTATQQRPPVPARSIRLQAANPPTAPPARNNSARSFISNMFGFATRDAPPVPSSILAAGQPTTNQSGVTAAAMNEEPVDEAQIARTTTTAEATGDAILPPPLVSIIATPEYPQMSTDVNSQFHVQVSLKYEECELATSKKTPLDIVCVLDNSGSMHGRKIESLKKAMEFVVDCLGQADRLAVVNFNSYPTGLHGLKKMNSDNKQISKNRLGELRSTGGTNILAGMQFGWDIIANRTTRNPTSCVFLLTDGQDRGNLEQKLQLARAMKAAGTSVFVFGFGADHDSEHMATIADAAEGTFTYIESDDMVIDAFGGTIGTQQGRSLSNIALNLQCCERDVQIAQLLAGRYSTNVQADRRAGSVQFLNMYMGETRDILLQMNVPASTTAAFGLVTASASYQLNDGTATAAAPIFEVPAVTCVVPRVATATLDANMPRDITVDVSLNRIICTAAVEEALRNADGGNFGIAKEVIAAAKEKLQNSVSFLAGHSTTTALMQELDDALLRVRSRADYDHGGRAMMTETMTTNNYQRSCYTKGGRAKKYQTCSSSGAQERAFTSKSSY